MFESEITSKDFDFIGLNSNLEQFGRRCQMSQKTILRSQAFFEEMCVQILLPSLSDDFRLLVSLEYSAEEDTAAMQLKYSGIPFDPMSTDNTLSLTLAKNAASEIIYSPIDQQPYTNQVNAKIR